MNKAKELMTTTDIVKGILMEYPNARNNDNLLYIKVCEKINKKLLGKSFQFVLLNLKELDLPQFESVRRTRQKLQAAYPELAGNSTVEGHRTVNETVFREYARKVNV